MTELLFGATFPKVVLPYYFVIFKGIIIDISGFYMYFLYSEFSRKVISKVIYEKGLLVTWMDLGGTHKG